MLRFDLNWARSNIGQKVNLHMKDGSVIVNVLIAHALKDSHEISAIYYMTPLKSRLDKVHLNEIAWAERLDTSLFPTDRIA